jgi:hypothetical protein
MDCIHLDEGFCSLTAVELDPDIGCLAYRSVIEIGEDDEEVYEEELLDDWDLEDLEVDNLLGKDSNLWDEDDV